MKVEGNETVMFPSANDIKAKENTLIYQKVHNAVLKKIYEIKIKSLDDHKMPLHLLRMMCQDAPIKSDRLESRWGRNWFVRKCKKFYQGKLKKIERSEKTNFFSFLS